MLFCTSKFSMEDQERTRLLILSPEASQEKIKDAILLKIERESNREKFRNFMESDPKRVWLRNLVSTIASAGVQQIVIPEELRDKIAESFFERHNNLIPRHQRDISRLLALIKAHALLNLSHRERIVKTVVVNDEDVQVGFSLYSEISTANELGLPPEVYNIYVKLRDKIPQEGATRKELQTFYYETFHRTIGKKRFDETLSILQSVGLITEEPDPNDRRQKLYTPCHEVFISKKENQHKKIGNQPERINTPQHRVPTTLVSVILLKEPYEGTCTQCGQRRVLYHQIKTANVEWGHVCQDCGEAAKEKIRKSDGERWPT